jgi:hypothetical protein
MTAVFRGFLRSFEANDEIMLSKRRLLILEELKVTPIQDKISNYKTDWRDHVNRMSRSSLPELITQYLPKERKDRCRPMKKLTDGFWGRNRPTFAYTLDSYMMMMMMMKRLLLRTSQSFPAYRSGSSCFPSDTIGPIIPEVKRTSLGNGRTRLSLNEVTNW